MQLDEETDVSERAGIVAEIRHVETGATACLRQRRSVRVEQRTSTVRGQLAGHQLRTEAGNTEPAAFFFGEDDDRERAARVEALPSQGGDGVESRNDTEGAVVCAPARHGIEV